MKIRITQYGYANDSTPDSNTRAHIGVQNIELAQDVSCAVTDSAKHALGAHVGDWLRIDFGSGNVVYRRIDDRAPENDQRVDMYMVQGYHRGLHDYADVSLTIAPLGAPVQHHVQTHTRHHHRHH
jgi:hypothetical protein